MLIAKDIIELVGTVLDLGGVLAIAAGTVAATVAFGLRTLRERQRGDAYRSYRQGVGRAILLGLELLVAADIIRTVAVAPTFGTVGVLAVIVLVRTFLSISLQVELEGRWPWQQGVPAPGGPSGSLPRSG